VTGIPSGDWTRRGAAMAIAKIPQNPYTFCWLAFCRPP